jgi:hypothetical protein
MANSTLKRFPVKYIRDRAKSAYVKDTQCYICGIESPLDLHHFHSVSQLFKKWCKLHEIVIEDLEDILAHRDNFITDHNSELYDDVRTLCKMHHKRLHTVYGQDPSLATAPKQARWCDKQKDKVNS